MADQNPGLDGAGKGAEDLELELEGGSDKSQDQGQGGDPLDDIKDPVARDEAKKYRAIARRNEKPDEKKPDEKPKGDAPSSEFLTKADFHKANERKAILSVTADEEVKANWDKIIPFYTPRRGKETPEDISEDIKDAIIIFKARNPEVIKDDSALELTGSPVIKASGGTGKSAPKTQDPPNFHLPKPPSEWYGKK